MKPPAAAVVQANKVFKSPPPFLPGQLPGEQPSTRPAKSLTRRFVGAALPNARLIKS